MQTRASAQQFLGALAQLVERLHGMQEVVGSIPTSSTTPPSVENPNVKATFGLSFLFAGTIRRWEVLLTFP
jgi:hypothetical protein